MREPDAGWRDRLTVIITTSPLPRHPCSSMLEAILLSLRGFGGLAGCRTLIVADGKLTGEVTDPILGREAKLEALAALTAERGLTPADAIAVGDGANDLAMVEAAGLGVAYRAKPALADKANARLDHSDLTALLALQGIAAPGFG